MRQNGIRLLMLLVFVFAGTFAAFAAVIKDSLYLHQNDVTGAENQILSDKMIVLSTQLNDWGENSARQTIALTEYFLEHYHIDPDRVYLHGMSGGGETGSLVMGLRPDLYTAYFMTASQWDGDLAVLAAAQTPVYMAIGAQDSYYGSQSLRRAYNTLRTNAI